MIRKLSMALALVIIPGGAMAFFALNRLEVVPLSDGVFEVIGGTGAAAPDYWCGAGDYAIAQLQTGATQRLYMRSEIGPSQTRPKKKAIQFSTSPPPDVSTVPSNRLSMKKMETT